MASLQFTSNIKLIIAEWVERDDITTIADLILKINEVSERKHQIFRFELFLVSDHFSFEKNSAFRYLYDEFDYSLKEKISSLPENQKNTGIDFSSTVYLEILYLNTMQAQLALVAFSTSKDISAEIKKLTKYFSDVIGKLEYRFFEKNLSNQWIYIRSTGYSLEARYRKLLESVLRWNSFFYTIKLPDVSSSQYFSFDGFERLSLRGSTAKEPPNFVVSKDESIIGLAIKATPIGAPQFIDPRDVKYSSLYLNYSSDEKTIYSEMCFCVLDDGEITGVFNFESYRSNFFDKLLFQNIARYLSMIGDALKFLNEQWILFYQKGQIISDIHDFYFQAHAKALFHDIQRLFELGSTIDIIDRVFSALVPDTVEKIDTHASSILKDSEYADRGIIALIEEAKQNYSSSKYLITSHINMFKNVGKRERHLLRNLIDEAIKNFRVIQKEGNSIPIQINNLIPERVELFESNMINAYVQQILENSNRHLNEKAKNTTNFHAKIDISYETRDVDNNQWIENYGVLKIRDNGPGVDNYTLSQLQLWSGALYEPRKKGRGLGRALAGAHSYMKLQRGWVELDSTVGEFFETRLVFFLQTRRGRLS